MAGTIPASSAPRAPLPAPSAPGPRPPGRLSPPGPAPGTRRLQPRACPAAQQDGSGAPRACARGDSARRRRTSTWRPRPAAPAPPRAGERARPLPSSSCPGTGTSEDITTMKVAVMASGCWSLRAPAGPCPCHRPGLPSRRPRAAGRVWRGPHGGRGGPGGLSGAVGGEKPPPHLPSAGVGRGSGRGLSPPRSRPVSRPGWEGRAGPGTAHVAAPPAGNSSCCRRGLPGASTRGQRGLGAWSEPQLGSTCIAAQIDSTF